MRAQGSPQPQPPWRLLDGKVGARPSGEGDTSGRSRPPAGSGRQCVLVQRVRRGRAARHKQWGPSAATVARIRARAARAVRATPPAPPCKIFDNNSSHSSRTVAAARWRRATEAAAEGRGEVDRGRGAGRRMGCVGVGCGCGSARGEDRGGSWAVTVLHFCGLLARREEGLAGDHERSEAISC